MIEPVDPGLASVAPSVCIVLVIGMICTPSFFPPAHEPSARALLDRLLAQDAPPKLPLFELVDARLAAGETDGWRYEDMPEDGEAWLLTVQALDDDAAARWHEGRFADLAREAQIELLLPEGFAPVMCWHLACVLEALLGATCRRCEVTHASCVAQGAPTCLLDVQWDPTENAHQRRASAASSYSKLCRTSAPRTNAGWATAAPEVGKSMLPSCAVSDRATPARRRSRRACPGSF